METRAIPEIVMDILKDYAMVNDGRKPLLDYLDELMATYGEMEKSYRELVLWQADMNKDMREMKIAMKKLQK